MTLGTYLVPRIGEYHSFDHSGAVGQAVNIDMIPPHKVIVANAAANTCLSTHPAEIEYY